MANRQALQEFDKEDGTETGRLALPSMPLTDLTPVGNRLVVGTRRGYAIVAADSQD